MVMSVLTLKKTELVGLDVGTWAVKLVRLARHEHSYQLTAGAIAEVHSGEGGNNAASTETAIRECLKKAGVGDCLAVCAAAGTEVMVRGFKFPPLPLKAVEQAVMLEAQSVCPLDMKNSVLDYQLVSSDPMVTERKMQEPQAQCGLMVVGTQRLIEQRVSQVKSAGIRPVLMDAEALALLNCITELHLIDACGTVAVIDVGHSKTSIVIYGQNGLPFVRDLKAAGGSILEQVSGELQMDAEAVRRTLCEHPGQEISKDQRNRVLLALNNAIRPLVMMINETLRYYSLQEKNSVVEKMFLSGGFSLIPMFTDMLTDALPVETCVLNPLEFMSLPAGLAQSHIQACGPAMAIAAGLAMRTL